MVMVCNRYECGPFSQILTKRINKKSYWDRLEGGIFNLICLLTDSIYVLESAFFKFQKTDQSEEFLISATLNFTLKSIMYVEILLIKYGIKIPLEVLCYWSPENLNDTI